MTGQVSFWLVFLGRYASPALRGLFHLVSTVNISLVFCRASVAPVFSFPRLIVVPLSSHEVDGVRKEKERLTAALDSKSVISSWNQSAVTFTHTHPCNEEDTHRRWNQCPRNRSIVSVSTLQEFMRVWVEGEVSTSTSVPSSSTFSTQEFSY